MCRRNAHLRGAGLASAPKVSEVREQRFPKPLLAVQVGVGRFTARTTQFLQGSEAAAGRSVAGAVCAVQAKVCSAGSSRVKIIFFALIAFAGVGARADYRPVEVKAVSALYDFHQLKMHPGEVVYLEVPRELKGSTVDWTSVQHRQDPREETECPRSPRDCKPAYTSVEFLDTHGRWQCWGGRGSGPCDSKFAEIRMPQMPETDDLYEFPRHGHIDAETGARSYEPLFAQRLRVRNLGVDDLYLHKVLFKVTPPEPTTVRDVIFSWGLDFGDFVTQRGRHYAGDADTGDYGHAMHLNRYSTPHHSRLPNEWRTEQGVLVIPLEAGRVLEAIDVAAGDMRRVPYGANPERYRGDANLTVELVRDGRVVDTLIDHENIGDNGIIRGSPTDITKSAHAGDMIRMYCVIGDASIMGIRLSYR